jgi:hypothetical protein
MITAFSIDAIVRHCWMTGVLAQRLADFEQYNPKISDQCFLSGLLHDGRAAFEQYSPPGGRGSHRPVPAQALRRHGVSRG